MLGFLSGRAKSIPLIGGFLFGVLGAVWSFVVVERLGEEMQQLSNAKAERTKQMQSLNGIASDYFIANEAAQQKNRVIGLIASIIGNFLLLLANLIAKREV